MEKVRYNSGVDWWLVGTAALVMILVIYAVIDAGWEVIIPLGASVLMFFVMLFGCWYEIEGDTLIVYQFFRPHRFPISKIKEVKKIIGYLATAGMSRKRVSIKFVDRSVLKSAMPLEISPKDRDAFISHLKEINPEIEVL